MRNEDKKDEVVVDIKFLFCLFYYKGVVKYLD